MRIRYGGQRSREPNQRAAGKGEGRQKRRLVTTIVLGSVVVHGMALGLFGLLKIAEYFQEPEAIFTVEKALSVPAPTREHRMSMARHRAMAPKPVFSERFVSKRPTAFALPELPEMPVDQMIPLDPAELVADQLSTLGVGAGLGSALGAEFSGGGGQGNGMSFFNIRDQSRSVVIMIDVSASMFGRTGDLDYSSGKLMRKGTAQAFQVVREEAAKLIDGLSVNTLFGIIHWSGSARLWKEALVPATSGHRAAAKRYLQEQVDYNKAGPRGGRPGGTRHDYALEALLALQPETAFMLTDGNATRSLGRGAFEVIEAQELLAQLEAAVTEGARLPRLHTIYYVTGKDDKEEERMLRSLARRTGAQFRKQAAEQGS